MYPGIPVEIGENRSSIEVAIIDQENRTPQKGSGHGQRQAEKEKYQKDCGQAVQDIAFHLGTATTIPEAAGLGHPDSQPDYCLDLFDKTDEYVWSDAASLQHTNFIKIF